MGTGINCWIEYDEYSKPPFSEQPEVLPLTDWSDLSTAKDYTIYGALSGIRNSTGIAPLFELRGRPSNPSWPLSQYLGTDAGPVGWLYPSEVRRALAHHGVAENTMSLEMQCVLRMLDFFASTIGDDRVRFVFEIQ